ncbi:MAG: hypothetical protein V3V97_09200 [Hyphomicrobiaceae bacterium]
MCIPDRSDLTLRAANSSTRLGHAWKKRPKKRESCAHLRNAPTSVMQMCLDNPRAGFMELFATHPRVENRINALSRMPQRVQRARPRTSNGGRVEFGKRSYG